LHATAVKAATGNHLLAQSWTGNGHLEQVSTTQRNTPDINMTMIRRLKNQKSQRKFSLFFELFKVLLMKITMF